MYFDIIFVFSYYRNDNAKLAKSFGFEKKRKHKWMLCE